MQAPMGVSPIQTRLPGEQYLKTFDAAFRVQKPVELRTTPFSYEPLPAYHAQVFARFEASKGLLVDAHV